MKNRAAFFMLPIVLMVVGVLVLAGWVLFVVAESAWTSMVMVALALFAFYLLSLKYRKSKG